MAEKKPTIVMDGVDFEKLGKVLKEVTDKSQALTAMVAEISKPATSELDKVVAQIEAERKSSDIPMPSLEDYGMKLSALMYTTGVRVEQLGIEADVANVVHQDVFSQALRASTGSNAKDREADGNLASQYEKLVADIKDRAYQVSKDKVKRANDIYGFIKYAMKARMNEAFLARNDGEA